MASKLKGYLSEAGELPRDILLGHVGIYAIADNPTISPEELEKRYANLGLDPKRLPNSIKPINAFEKATQSINGTNWTMADGTTATLLCREVVNDRGAMTRHLVREVRDGANVRLRHDTVAELIFYKAVAKDAGRDEGTQVPRFTAWPHAMADEELPHVQEALLAIRNAYAQMTQFYDGQALRRTVRSYMLALDGIELKGSVYFVPVEQADTVEKIAELLNDIGNGTEMQLMPLVDLPKQRTWVVEKFQTESVEKLKKLAGECNRVMNTRKTITGDAYLKLKNEYDEVLAQATRYQKLTKGSMDYTAGAAEFALDVLGELQTRMITQED